MAEQDNGQKILQDILAKLFAEQAAARVQGGRSFLLSADKVFLGEVSESQYARDSLLNKFGPYGSEYSATSIFNQYSQYGSPYGSFSINNPYTSTPPQLMINGVLKGYVTKNPYLPDRIDADAFIATLRNDVRGLLSSGNLIANEEQVRATRKESFLFGQDGKFLGRLNKNPYDGESVFNQYGNYGSRYSKLSIWNTFSPYGSQFGEISAFGLYSAKPPRLYVRGGFVGYLTKNPTLRPAIDPENLENWVEGQRL